MHNQQTIEKLHNMRLPAMAKHFRAQLENPAVNALSFEERFAILVDAEYTQRHQNGIKKLLNHAKLRIPPASLEDIDYNPKRKLDRSYIARLSESIWVTVADLNFCPRVAHDICRNLLTASAV